MSSPRDRRLWLAAIVLPWVLPVLVLLLQVSPSGVIDLRGEWEWRTVSGEPSAPADGKQGWKPVALPAFFNRVGITEREFELRKTVSLSARETPDESWFLVLGNTRSSVARVEVNGHIVGETAAFEAVQKADFQGLDGVSVPGAVLRDGANELVLRIRSSLPVYAGLLDERLFFGPSRAVAPWFLRTTRLEAFFRNGPLLLFVFMGLIVLVLARVSASERDRRLAWRALALNVAAAVYQVGLSGLGLSGLLTAHQRITVISIGIFATLTALLGFVVDYFHETRPWWIRANVAIGTAYVVSSVVQPLGPAFQAYTGWTFALFVLLSTLTVRGARRRPDLLTLLIASALFSIGVTGLLDMLSSLGLVHTPPLFSLSISNAPLIAGTVVIGTFIGFSQQNRQLTVSLGRSNEELARALVAAREATRVKSEFLANVSHELRTPLNSIINIPEGLLEDFEGEGEALSYTGEPSRTARYLKTLHSSGLHLLSVVNQVLDFSKLEADRMTLHPETVRPGALIDEVTRTLESLASKRGITFEIDGDLTLEFRADPVKVAQVLLNLGSNAVKFSPDGAVVTISARRTEQGVELRVRDRGIGISAENLSLIFEGFRQVEGGATRRFGGTGLGLAISRRLVALHGGTLTVESALGQGSTFIAAFLREPGPPLEVAPPRLGPNLPVVLVIDDEPMVHETLRLSLRHLEVEVISVEEPRSALATAQAHAPALIILDVMMPRTSGLTLLRQLQDSETLKRTPVLVLSAYPSNRELVSSLGARWMSKPWDPETLVKTVSEMLALTAAAPGE